MVRVNRPSEPLVSALQTRYGPKSKAYVWNFTSAKRYVLTSFASTESAMMKKRASRFMVSSECRLCHCKRLSLAALAVRFAGLDIADLSRVPLKQLAFVFRPWADRTAKGWAFLERERPGKAATIQRIAEDFTARVEALLGQGLGYFTLERSTPTLSPGELQRLRLAT